MSSRMLKSEKPVVPKMKRILLGRSALLSCATKSRRQTHKLRSYDVCSDIRATRNRPRKSRRRYIYEQSVLFLA